MTTLNSHKESCPFALYFYAFILIFMQYYVFFIDLRLFYFVFMQYFILAFPFLLMYSNNQI